MSERAEDRTDEPKACPACAGYITAHTCDTPILDNEP